MKSLTRRICAAAVLASTSLALANTASAVDLRDWSRKFNVASERFVKLASFNNQAVLDKETQLVWQVVPAAAGGWESAVHFCYASVAGGRSGWRLPSVSELMSLLGTDRKLPVGHPFANLTAQTWLWSITNHAVPQYEHSAYLMNPLSGQQPVTNSKTNLNSYLCVRGAGGADR
jgi:hypothetical protein